MLSRVLVCPVAYNEYQKLKNAIERFLSSTAFGKVDYLIVDDGSTDGTGEMIRSFEDRGVKTLRHDQRSGVGAAIRTAITYAGKHGYETIVIMAGNDKDDPNEILTLVKGIEQDGCDCVQGSRYLKGGTAGGAMPFYRRIATRIHPMLLSVVTGKKITDSTNGFRAMKLALFDDQRMNLEQAWLNAYELEPYILFKVLRLGYKFQEVPVTKIYPAKQLGYTKMKPISGWWSILRPIILLGLGIRK